MNVGQPHSSATDFQSSFTQHHHRTRLRTHDMQRHESVDSNAKTWEKYRAAIAHFLRRIDIPIEVLCPPARESLEKLVLEYTTEWEKMGLIPDRWRPFFETGLNAGLMYSHTRVDVQAQIASFSLLVACIDDQVVSDEAMGSFTSSLLSGTCQLDPLLDCIVDNLRRMSEFFPPYAAKCITLSTIEFIDGCVHDKDVVEMKLHTSALPYLNFKRLRNGIGAAYAFFVWDKFLFPDVSTYVQSIPEMMIDICLCNDILSFYKEQLAGENDNYIHSRALVTNKDVDTVLSDVIDDAVRSDNAVKSILQGEEEKETWERFLKSYAAFHYVTSRYRLRELLDIKNVQCK